METNTAIIAGALIVIIVIAGAVAISTMKNSRGGTHETSGVGATETRPPPATTSGSATPTTSHEETMSTPQGASTTTTGAPNASLNLSTGASITIWDLYDNVERIVIAPYYDEEKGMLEDWPVLLNGTLYAISDIRVSYRIVKSNGFNATLNMTWSLSTNKTFTAACADLEGNIISQETFHNVYLIRHTLEWTGGKRFSYSAYLYNASALYWYHTIPTYDAPDTGAWKMGVLGGDLTSNTGSLTWSCAAAKAPENVDLIMNCHSYFRENGDVWGVFGDDVFQQINEKATAFLMSNLNPLELFTRDFLQVLPNVTGRASGWISSGVPDYDKVEYQLTYMGKIPLPGLGVKVDAWRLDFKTSPAFLNGSYIITASTITPIWYKVTEVSSGGEVITIEYRLLGVHLLDQVSAPLESYLGRS